MAVVLFSCIVMVRDGCFIVVVVFFCFIAVTVCVFPCWIVMVCFIAMKVVMFTFRCIVMKSIMIKDVVTGMVLFASMVLFSMFSVMTIARNFPVKPLVVRVAAVLLPMPFVTFPVTMMSTTSMGFKESKGADGWKNSTSKERLRRKHDIQETHDEK